MRDQTDNRLPEEIESDIARTRADFSSTIDAIQSKLTPSELMDQAVDYALTTTPGAFGANLVNSVRDNPIPVALIGVGIAWLMAAGRQSPVRVPRSRQRAAQRSAYYPDAEFAYDRSVGMDGGRSEEGLLHRAASMTSEAGRDLKDKASEVGQRLSETASSVTGRARELGETTRGRIQESAADARARASQLGQRSQVQYSRAKERMDHLIDEQPLVIGALGIAIGAALGAALPVTRRENEMMGTTRDDLLGRAKEMASEQAETVKQSAQRLADMAKQEAGRVKDEVTGAVKQGMDQSRSVSSGGLDSSQFGSESIPSQQRPH